MKRIPIKTRLEVYEKYDKRCAYCGILMPMNKMQIDHIEPHWHNFTEEQANKHGIKKGSHEIENLNPSCIRCNKWKGTYTLSQFRKVIEESLKRLQRDTPNFRLARDFGLLKETPKKNLLFYFEEINAINKNK